MVPTRSIVLEHLHSSSPNPDCFSAETSLLHRPRRKSRRLPGARLEDALEARLWYRWICVIRDEVA